MGSSSPMRQTKKQTDQTEDTTETNNQTKKNSKNTRKRNLGCFLNRDWRVVVFYDRYIYPGNYHSAPCINKIELFKCFLCVSISGSGNGFSSTEPFRKTGRASNTLSEQTHAKHTPSIFRSAEDHSYTRSRSCKRRKTTIKTPAELGNLVETKCLQCKDPQFATCTHG